MRIDPATGAVVSSRWRLDPVEPQSSFVTWAKSAGFDRRYHAEVDGWHASVQFAIGGALRYVRLDGEEVQRWAGEQRPPHGVEVGVHRDRDHGDSYVGVAYPPTVTDGPPPEPGDLDLLARAARLDLGPVGDDWQLTDEYLAFERVARRPPSADEVARVVRDGTAAGRCYAAHLLPDAWAALAGDHTPLSVADRPLTTVGEYARIWSP